MRCERCNQKQQELNEARIDLGAMLSEARNALYQLSNAVEAGGGNPNTHKGCLMLRAAIDKAAETIRNYK